MAYVPTPPSWDLESIRELVKQHDLERGRIEYKRELGNDHTVLQAIAAMANTFGGTVLVGVDEDREGTGCLVGVPGSDRDRLARMCWDQLVPPFSPDIMPVRLGQERYVLAVVVDHLGARRPVMLARDNKVLVRIEGHNAAADWYRLRDLYAEQSASVLDTGLRAADQDMPAAQADVHDIDVVLRGRLLLTGPPGRSCRITESGRTAVSLRSAVISH
jgi:predicted HTH transcriptional regulator